jgi:hypothetical protein
MECLVHQNVKGVVLEWVLECIVVHVQIINQSVKNVEMEEIQKIVMTIVKIKLINQVKLVVKVVVQVQVFLEIKRVVILVV